MTEEERIMDRRYAILTLAILERAYKDAMSKDKMLAWEAKRWISQNAWGLIVLLDLPVSEKQYLKWLSEIKPKKIKKKGMLLNDKRERENITQTETDNRSPDHMPDKRRSITAGRHQQDYILQMDEQ